jgi:hypothetical protein
MVGVGGNGGSIWWWEFHDRETLRGAVGVGMGDETKVYVVMIGERFEWVVRACGGGMTTMT